MTITPNLLMLTGYAAHTTAKGIQSYAPELGAGRFRLTQKQRLSRCTEFVLSLDGQCLISASSVQHARVNLGSARIAKAGGWYRKDVAAHYWKEMRSGVQFWNT